MQDCYLALGNFVLAPFLWKIPLTSQDLAETCDLKIGESETSFYLVSGMSF